MIVLREYMLNESLGRGLVQRKDILLFGFILIYRREYF